MHGALANPAALMDLQRRDQTFHFRLGASVDVRDDAGLYDIGTDDANEDLKSDIEDAIDEIDVQNVACDVTGAVADETVCLDGLDSLSALATRARDILARVDGRSSDAQATFDLGFAFTKSTYPFALHLQARATGRGRLDASEGDRAYFDTFEATLADARLTYGEITDNPEFAFDENGTSVDVARPEDVLTSPASGGYLARVTIGASVAATVDVKGHPVDIGVTPKLSSLIASGIRTSLDTEFDDGMTTTDRLDASEVDDTSFTFDLGAATALAGHPVRLAAVLRNVVPESVTSAEGFEFESTPQLVVGGAYALSAVTLNADLALNEADVDSFATQPLALGAEVDLGLVALRGGLSVDLARDDAGAAISLGFGLGPLQVGARTGGFEQLQAGAQLSYSF